MSLLSLEPEGQPDLSEYPDKTGSTVWTQGRSVEQGLCVCQHRYSLKKNHSSLNGIVNIRNSHHRVLPY